MAKSSVFFVLVLETTFILSICAVPNFYASQFFWEANFLLLHCCIDISIKAKELLPCGKSPACALCTSSVLLGVFSLISSFGCCCISCVVSCKSLYSYQGGSERQTHDTSWLLKEKEKRHIWVFTTNSWYIFDIQNSL